MHVETSIASGYTMPPTSAYNVTSSAQATFGNSTQPQAYDGNATANVYDFATQMLTTTLLATIGSNNASVSNSSLHSNTFAHAPANAIEHMATQLSDVISNATTNLSNFIADYAATKPNDTIAQNAETLFYDDMMPNLNAINTFNGYIDHPCDPTNLSTFNCTPQEYTEFRLGPQTMPTFKKVLVTIIFGIIFITGVLGNVLVCLVIVQHSTMHTATNYYLFSLAVSDLLVLLLGLPTEVFLYYHQYPYLFGLPFCKMRAFISEASTYVSVLTIVAFSMERFLAICHPLHLYAMSGFKRAVRIIVALWIISFITALPFGLYSKIIYLEYPPDGTKIEMSAFCNCEIGEFIDRNIPIFELSFGFFFVVPMIIIIILYGRMGMQIRSRTVQQLGVTQGSMHRESRHSQSRKAIIRMLAAVVITFFVCWLPFHLQRLLCLYGKNYEHFDLLNEVLFSIAGFAYYVSCTINPILYNVMSHRYRVAFKEILCGKRRSVYFNNGFARDQSSFRETTIATSLAGHGNCNYDRVQSVRIRSLRQKNNETIKSNNALWIKKNEYMVPLQKESLTETPSHVGTNVVVVVDTGMNGRPKVYTENEVQETLINKDNETCI